MFFVQVSAVVSLGTGLIPVTELKDIDVFRPESIWDTAKLAYGISTMCKTINITITLKNYYIKFPFLTNR